MLGFRVWNLRHNWFENNSHFYVNKEGEFCCHDKGFPMDQYVCMQSTGVRDSKGNRIFEMDIIKVSHHETSENMPVKSVLNFHLVYAQFYYVLGEFKIEIIGNMMQNPELLEQLDAGI